MAIFCKHRSEDLGARMLKVAKEQARLSGCRQVSLLAFEQNERAVQLYRRNGFAVIDRAPVTPHEVIRYTGGVQ